MVAIALEALVDSPAPRVGITITGLGLTDSVVTVWRTCEGERDPVQGYRRTVQNDSTYLVDFFAPLERPVTYEVEVVSGADGPSRTISAPVTVPSTTGWLMDALVPGTAVPIVRERSNEDIYLRSPALSEMEYQAGMSVFDIMGSPKRMALFGQRMAESGLDASVGVRSAVENARLKKLLMSSAHLVFRPLPAWGDLQLAGTLYLGTPVIRQTPVNVLTGGKLTWWDIKSDVVAAPAVKVLTATFSYGDVDMMMDSYQQKQDLMAGKTYLDDLKNPIG